MEHHPRLTLRDAEPPRPEDQRSLPELLAELRDALSGTRARLLVHGSRARGEARPASDLDVLEFREGGDAAPLDRLRQVCGARGISLEVLDAARADPEFVRRVEAYGIPVTADGFPAPPPAWPPARGPWTGEGEPPGWITRPLGHARENLAMAARDLADAVEAARLGADAFPQAPPEQAARLASRTVEFSGRLGLCALARGLRRVMALLGEEVPSRDPADDDRALLDILGPATRAASPGFPRRVRPAFLPGLRGDLLSVAEAACAARSGFLPLLDALPDAGGALARIAPAAAPGFEAWLAALGAPPPA